MFGFAKFIARNGIIVIALIGAGYFLFGGKKEVPKPSSPWAANAPAQVANATPAKASMTDKVLKVADGAAKYAGVQAYAPTALRDQAVGNINKTQTALENPNKNQD